MGTKKLIKTIIVLLVILLVLTVCWYASPYGIRKVYYLNCDTEGVYKYIVEDPNFPFSVEGFSKTYEYNNKYLMTAEVRIDLTKVNELLADVPQKREYIESFVRIKAEIFSNDDISNALVSNLKNGLGYKAIARIHYIGFSYLPLSYRARFLKDTKIRITVLKADPKFEGCEGTLIIKPETMW